MTVAELKEMIDSNDWDIKYSRFGIRIQELPFEPGPMDHKSKVWIDEEETDCLLYTSIQTWLSQ